ncbi:IS1380 family transposase [Solitalea lacus]|uniref:IS1380 family transposase n=1 Tax=Solitalea lacus TaxID=2911172 RepID=UPI001EDBAF0B|nr:IS1380 family transposase [Solitalea lacus]UKJ06955.1 IS1380 family transposase [Solitalea lacus]
MELEIGYTDKELTPWGGMVLLRKMLDKIGFGQKLTECADLPQPGSNRGYDAKTIIESFMVSVWCGANRFLHTEVTRHDAALAKIFEWRRTPGQDTHKRFFAKFNQAMNQRVSCQLYSWLFEQVPFDNYTLDCDSSILTRYGTAQQGACKGYNPVKPGRMSHHPLMAFVADVKMVANFWLRSGNSSASEGFVPFLEDTLEKLKSKTVSLIRLDSGFYSKGVMEYLEEKQLNYVIAARFYEPIQTHISSLQTWLKLDEGIEISEMKYQSPLWDQPRRMVVVRQRLKDRPQATGKTLRLFAEDELYNQYRYSCYVTNLSLSGAEVWRLYRGRADAENRIKELKYDFGLDSFNLKQFFGTEAALNFAMIAYNLMAIFRQFILQSKVQHTLSTLRYKTFAIGAYFEQDGDRMILKMALHLKRREWFTGLWAHAKSFQHPFVFSNA